MSEIATAVETPATPPPAEESTSLSEHEAEFHGPKDARTPRQTPAKEPPQAAAVETPVAETEGAEPPTETDETRDAQGRFRKRSAKNEAKAEDVPRIRELTKKLHELERERDEWKARVSTPPAPSARIPEAPAPVAAPSTPAVFTDREPTITDFANEADPYASYVRALARYDRKREQFEADQVAAKERAEREEKDRITYAETTYANVQREYATRLATFKETHKDFDTLLKASADAPLPPLLQATVLLHDKGPELVYYLLRHPDQLAEMTLLTDGRPVNDQTVAIATRWLTSRAQAAPTGSTAPSAPKQFTVPRPPNPVQTGPMSTGDELPDDSSSLAEHEQAFTRGKRRSSHR